MNYGKMFKFTERRRNKKIMKIKKIFINFVVIIFISTVINGVYSSKVHASSATTIIGQAELTQEQALNYFRTRNSEKSDQDIKDFISIVWQEANLEGIRPDVVFTQIMKETNFLRFTGDVKECQNNFAGIGATGGGVQGAYFKDVRTGVRAVVQHLKAYSSTEILKSSCVDPRFTYVKRGISPYVEWLGIGENPNYPDEGWAADNNYGKNIVSMMKVAKNLSNDYEDNTNNIKPGKAKIQTYDIMEGSKYITTNKLEMNKLYTIKGYASSENGVLYEFWVKDVSVGAWTKIRDYKEDKYANWTPDKPGQYAIKVNVKDKNSNLDLDGKVEKTFTVIDENAKPGKATIQTYDIMLGNKYITGKNLEMNKLYIIKGYASSENGVLYEFWVKDVSVGVWTKIRDYKEDRYANWTPNKSGQYAIKVNVKDKNSNLELDGKVEKTFTVASSATNPGKAKIQTYDIMEGSKYITTNNLELSKLYTIKGYASSENGVLYEFWVKDVSAGVWTKIRDYKEDRYANWTPSKPGQYIIKVNVKDKNSNLELDGKVEKTFIVTTKGVNPGKAKIQTYDIMLGNKYITDTKLDLNKTYTIKGYASSNNGVLYEFWIKDVRKGNWVKIRDYKEDRLATFSVSNQSNYIIKVNVKDKYSLNSVDSYVEKNFIIGDLIKTIVLDAGHGGKDSGALSSKATGYLHEADIVQKITLKLGNMLKKEGYNVIYTRDKVDNYNYPSITQNLEDRINVANSIKADLFMSIHADSADSSSANGYGSHYSSYRPNLDNSGIYSDDEGVSYDRTPCDAALKSKLLSQIIVNEFSSLGTSNRGTRDHNLYVTKWANMPSVLVETGFVSNDIEVRKLNSDSYQNQIAQKLYNAITKLFSI
ncbi:N-acetylmuramoyl-L-alanine amidase [Clostridium sporogenes]|uniref:N-acetylmuramoyl-L-alanine amidase n=1 Tax=Clostridium sporogenes TaxID=1509 RepID=UPI0013D65A44|nr:N-acetylmuramoyl-L-alanine amidase [Clostridium sporogenes]NFV12578.1 N-acetylmuramoyl-L-alanine amidase [Clostridium sporogenes]